MLIRGHHVDIEIQRLHVVHHNYVDQALTSQNSTHTIKTVHAKPQTKIMNLHLFIYLLIFQTLNKLMTTDQV